MDIQRVKETIALDPSRMSTLRLVREMNLPEGAVAGDFVRCAIFDKLHGHKEWTQLQRVEVVFFDPNRTDESVDLSIQAELVACSSRKPWVVKNLAREHPVARSLAQSMDGLMVTASAVAIRMLNNERLEVVAPFGVDDLLNGVLRPTKSELSSSVEKMYSRENWKTRYPLLRVEL
ncbi:MAG: nucleotidyltransferase family protein [Myxococcales bacterium]|nr:nucleotidyltransferase family protein [Myxococcales bacterium]